MTTNLEYHSGSSRVASKSSLEMARRDPTGKFTKAQAFDRTAGHWAYPDQVLEDCGYKVAFYGDTGGGSFAITECGLLLAGNGYAKAVEVETERARLTKHIGKRLF